MVIMGQIGSERVRTQFWEVVEEWNRIENCLHQSEHTE